MNRFHRSGVWKIRPSKLQSRFSNDRHIGQIVKAKVQSELKNNVVTLSDTIEANHGQRLKRHPEVMCRAVGAGSPAAAEER